MSAVSLTAYRLTTRLLEPLAPLVLNARLNRGKERRTRLPERLAKDDAARPVGKLVWMHGASVGECRLLLGLFDELRRARPELHAVITSQTLTAADMVATATAPGVIHRMAPIDGPASVRRFLDRWRPDMAVFAEGEIWPNFLAGLERRQIPAALVNGRMTRRSIEGWARRPAAARELFGGFRFLGAADEATAAGLEALSGRVPDVTGNLKRALPFPPADAVQVNRWRGALANRVTVLAASTHPGEEALVLEAFRLLRAHLPDALLVLAPRHPERGEAITDTCRAGGWRVRRRATDMAPPVAADDILVADTLGELALWFELSAAVFLGGANVQGVGGHNPIEPLQLGRTLSTGPYAHNFTELMAELKRSNAVRQVDSAHDLANDWRDAIAGASPPVDWNAVNGLFARGRQPLDRTVDGVLALLDGDGQP